eukprot:Nitzschia sp. Nitz4//scaffold418_size9641//282//1832//NITZ4_009090-RA/size9641-processed-gene-0.2-mRNA-1//1//CDS//3329551384//2783//frame0
MVEWWKGGLFCPVSSVDDGTSDATADLDSSADHSHVILENRLFDLRKVIETLRQQVSEWQLKSPVEVCKFTPERVKRPLADDVTAPTVVSPASTLSTPISPSTPEQEQKTSQEEKEEEYPYLPTDILVDFVAPFIADRLTYNAFAMMNREIYQACFTRPPLCGENEAKNAASPSDSPPKTHLLPPWPTIRLFLGIRLWSLEFSPNQQLLVIGGTNGCIGLIDRYHGPWIQLPGHLGRIYSIVFTPDGNTMVTLSGDGEICIWDMNPPPTSPSMPLKPTDNDNSEGDPSPFTKPFCPKMPEAALKYRISTNATHSLSLALDPNQSQLALGGASDIRWYTYPPPAGKDVWTLEMAQGCMVESLVFSPDGLSIAAGTSYNCAFVWDVASGEMTDMFPVPGGIHSVAFSPDGKFLVVASDNPMLVVFQVRGDYIGMVGGLQGHTDLVWSVVWEGDWIVTAGDDGTVRIWSGKTFDCLRILPQRKSSLYGVSLDAATDTVASVGEDGMVEIWNMKSVVTPP